MSALCAAAARVSAFATVRRGIPRFARSALTRHTMAAFAAASVSAVGISAAFAQLTAAAGALPIPTPPPNNTATAAAIVNLRDIRPPGSWGRGRYGRLAREPVPSAAPIPRLCSSLHARHGLQGAHRGPSRGTQPAPARGGHARRRAAADPRRRRLRARPASLTHRIAYLMRTGRRRASEILAITFTNKAAQEMRERVELLVGRGTRAMWVMTFHSACARMLRAEATQLGYTRQFTIYDAGRLAPAHQALPRRARHRRQALHAARDPRPDLRREEQAARRRRLPPARRLLLRADRRRRLRALRARAPPHERDGLRRPARPRRQRARALPRGPRPLRDRVPLRAGRRVPGHEPRAVPLAPAARRASTATWRSSATTISRSTASAAPTSRTSSTSRTTSRTRTSSSSSRTTAPRRRSSSAANAVIAQQPRSQAQGAVDRPRRGRPDPGARAGRRARRGALRGRRDRAARRRGRVPRRDRGLLPHERAVAGARGHARAARTSPTR